MDGIQITMFKMSIQSGVKLLFIIDIFRVNTYKYNYLFGLPTFMLYESTQFPRQKQYLANLNLLLDSYQTQSILLASGQRRQMSAQQRPKTMNMQRLGLNDLNNPSFKPLHLQTVGFLHNRSTSNFTGRGSQKITPQKITKNSQQARKQKMVNMLSTQNFRKQLMNTRKMSAVQAQYRTSQTKIKQKKKDYDLRFNVLKNANLIHRQISERRTAEADADLKLQNSGINDIQRSASVEIKNSQEKRQYLRKNTSINKSILNTIIKLKLTKHNNIENQVEKCVKNEQIVKMIKVYKGVEPVISISKPNIQSPRQISNREKDPLYIEGWYNDTEDFQFNRSHSPKLANAAYK